MQEKLILLNQRSKWKIIWPFLANGDFLAHLGLQQHNDEIKMHCGTRIGRFPLTGHLSIKSRRVGSSAYRWDPGAFASCTSPPKGRYLCVTHHPLLETPLPIWLTSVKHELYIFQLVNILLPELNWEVWVYWEVWAGTRILFFLGGGYNFRSWIYGLLGKSDYRMKLEFNERKDRSSLW